MSREEELLRECDKEIERCKDLKGGEDVDYLVIHLMRIERAILLSSLSFNDLESVIVELIDKK